MRSSTRVQNNQVKLGLETAIHIFDVLLFESNQFVGPSISVVMSK